MPAILGSRQAPSPHIKKGRYGAGQFVGYRVDTTMKAVFRPPWLLPPLRFCRTAGQWLGGDEFVVVARGLHSDAQAADLGAVRLASFQSPFELSRCRCHVGVTVGYALAPLDAMNVDSMVKHADAAMYAGKQGGKNCVRWGGAAPGMTLPGRL